MGRHIKMPQSVLANRLVYRNNKLETCPTANDFSVLGVAARATTTCLIETVIGLPYYT